jgi:predicted TIM-barrel fold metal-dependent hydrolase
MGSESEFLASLPLTSDQVDGILGENARRFIGL